MNKHRLAGGGECTIKIQMKLNILLIVLFFKTYFFNFRDINKNVFITVKRTNRVMFFATVKLDSFATHGHTPF